MKHSDENNGGARGDETDAQGYTGPQDVDLVTSGVSQDAPEPSNGPRIGAPPLPELLAALGIRARRVDETEPAEPARRFYPECPKDEGALRWERFTVMRDYDRALLFARDEGVKERLRDARAHYIHRWNNRIESVRQRMRPAPGSGCE